MIRYPFASPARALLATLAALVYLFVSGCDASRPANAAVQAETAPLATTVRVAEVSGGQTTGVPLRFSGIVQAAQRATLTFQVSGTLRSRRVTLGQQVAAGQVLGQVYNPGLAPAADSARARLEELNTQYRQAQREWERSRQLRERGVVSEQALEQLAARRDGLKASVATAEASLAEAQRLLAESDLKAPFPGRIEALLVEEDEFVAAGQPVLRMSAQGRREVEIRVPAYLLDQLRLGEALPVWPVHDRRLPAARGQIVEIAQPGAVRGELHPVLVSLPADSLDSGTPVEVELTPQQPEALTVPLLSVVRGPGGASVFRVRDGRADRLPVSVQRVIGERVAVAADGLQAGDQVVYAGMTRLVDGDLVEVR